MKSAPCPRLDSSDAGSKGTIRFEMVVPHPSWRLSALNEMATDGDVISLYVSHASEHLAVVSNTQLTVIPAVTKLSGRSPVGATETVVPVLLHTFPEVVVTGQYKSRTAEA